MRAKYLGPLVSCIMPTANRRSFVSQAISSFLQQDYPNKELIIVDDGEELVEDLVPDSSLVRYIHLQERLPIGTKRNIACNEAKGSLIAHWDDDDWYASWRLTYQIEELLHKRADVCGLAYPYFYEPDTQTGWHYQVPDDGIPWVYGATLCYTRSFWYHNPFQPIQIGEDTRFVWSSPTNRVLPLENFTFFLGRIHSSNTSRKRTEDPCWHRVPIKLIHSLFGANMAL